MKIRHAHVLSTFIERIGICVCCRLEVARTKSCCQSSANTWTCYQNLLRRKTRSDRESSSNAICSGSLLSSPRMSRPLSLLPRRFFDPLQPEYGPQCHVDTRSHIVYSCNLFMVDCYSYYTNVDFAITANYNAMSPQKSFISCF